MNIENEKISGRQLGRLVFYDYFALTTLLMPGMLAKAVGMDAFFRFRYIIQILCYDFYILRLFDSNFNPIVFP